MLDAERLVVLDVIAHTRARDRERMYRALYRLTREQVDDAIGNLERAGVIRAANGTVQASDALKRLEALGLVTP